MNTAEKIRRNRIPKPSTNGDGHEANKPKPAERFTIGELQRRFPKLHEPVIDGLLRERETMNIISMSKVGKSWLMYEIGLSIAVGRDLFGRFRTAKGKVFLIDNELHKPTIASRIKTVASAMGIPHADYADAIEVLPLRGNLRDINQIEVDLADLQAGQFRVVVYDAKYRMMAPGTSENDNRAETDFYNRLDRYAEMTGAAQIAVHHSSKGSQADKRVTDVGAGAGAQSRAADTHLVIREHEDPDTVVLEAAVRSFAPVEPLALKWIFPRWIVAGDVDTSKLKGRMTVQEQRQHDRDDEGIRQISRALESGPLSRRKLLERTGISRDRMGRLLNIMLAEKTIDATECNIAGNESREYFLPPN